VDYRSRAIEYAQDYGWEHANRPRPWCALSDIGGGVMQENCSMRSMEMCRQEVISGDRGFCNPNPRWQGSPVGVRQSPARRKRPAY